jgi:hypothetical protein
MNEDNFQKVIDAIEVNGMTNFNMASFFGFKNRENADETKVWAHQYSVSPYTDSMMKTVMKRTNLFNCDSVGCIAGFAVAVKHNWKAPSWFKSRNMTGWWVESFEKEACEFLDLSFDEVRNLFYNSGSCVWKFLVYYTNDYPNLEVISEDDECYIRTRTPEFMEQYKKCFKELPEDEWSDESTMIRFQSIDWKTAVDVLYRIKNKEIFLYNEKTGEPYFASKRKNK